MEVIFQVVQRTKSGLRKPECCWIKKDNVRKKRLTGTVKPTLPVTVKSLMSVSSKLWSPNSSN